MGTRADFYVGKGSNAEWLGSIAWDGYPNGAVEEKVLKSKTEDDFRSSVTEFLDSRKDGTKPEDGWPWPWPNSALTDYSYAFFDGEVYHTEFRSESYEENKGWYSEEMESKRKKLREKIEELNSPGEEEEKKQDVAKVVKEIAEIEKELLALAPKITDWPDMKDRQNVTLGPRSGVMVLGVKK